MTEKEPGWLKPVVDYLPLVAFLAAYFSSDLMKATLVLLVVTGFVLILSFVVSRRIPLVPLVTAAVVGVFGGLTLWLQDETFIKMKPTVVYLVFSVLLGAGLFLGKNPIKALMGQTFPMSDQGWKLLAQRFCAFFVIMAIANELVWRNVSTDSWMLWKFPGCVLITFAFMICQAGLMMRYKTPDQK